MHGSTEYSKTSIASLETTGHQLSANVINLLIIDVRLSKDSHGIIKLKEICWPTRAPTGDSCS